MPAPADPRTAPDGLFSPAAAGPLMAMLEVTNRCNLDCPICFSNANRPAWDLSHDEVRQAVRNLLAVTGRPIQVQISGGEPTVRDDLPQLVALCRAEGIRFVEIITNGVRISREPAYLAALKAAGVTGVYLQFDGLRAATHQALRGADLTGVRAQALANIRAAGMCCTLAVAVTRGVNEDEIGAIVDFAFANLDIVKVVNFQSATRFAGRFELGPAHGGFSVAELTGLIAAQTGLPADSFLGDFLGHSDCNAMTLAYKKDGGYLSLFHYIRSKDVARFLGRKKRERLLDLWEGRKAYYLKHLANPAAWRLIAKAAAIFGPNPASVVNTPHLLIFAKSFMERAALTPERVGQCCYAVTTPQGVYSFCAYNNLHRFASPA
ncbi:MAG: radical SAM protein [Pseudomonadota bacterium]